jgi:hypothetical protein
MTYAQMMTAAEMVGGGALGLISLWFAWQNGRRLKAIYDILTKGREEEKKA